MKIRQCFLELQLKCGDVFFETQCIIERVGPTVERRVYCVCDCRVPYVALNNHHFAHTHWTNVHDNNELCEYELYELRCLNNMQHKERRRAMHTTR